MSEEFLLRCTREAKETIHVIYFESRYRGVKVRCQSCGRKIDRWKNYKELKDKIQEYKIERRLE